MNGKEFIKALNHIVEEKHISKDVVYEAMELALQTAYKKNFDSKTNVRVDINRETGDIKVFSYLVVVDDVDFGREEYAFPASVCALFCRRTHGSLVHTGRGSGTLFFK